MLPTIEIKTTQPPDKKPDVIGVFRTARDKLAVTMSRLKEFKLGEAINDPRVEYYVERQHQHEKDAQDIAEDLITSTLTQRHEIYYEEAKKLSAEIDALKANNQPIPDDLINRTNAAYDTALDELGKEETAKEVKSPYNRIKMFLLGIPRENQPLFEAAYLCAKNEGKKAMSALVQIGKKYSYPIEPNAVAGSLDLYDIYKMLGLTGLKLAVKACLGDWGGEKSGYDNLLQSMQVFSSGGNIELTKK